MKNPFVERALRFKSFKLKEGKLYMWNIAGILMPLSLNSYSWRLLEYKFGQKEAMSYLFNLGKIQGKHATNIIINKFGFSNKSIDEKKRILNMVSSQGEFGGHGLFKCIKFDSEKDIYIISGFSSMAEDYKNSFGLQKNPIDHFLRGIATSTLETLTKKKMLAIETSCIAVGKRNCTFVIKPFDKWNKKDPFIKSQIPNKLYLMKEIGSKKEPFEKM